MKVETWLQAEKLEQIKEWGRLGLTNKQIAQNMGISVSTLYDWQQKHLEVSNTLKEGKAVADWQVENALFKKATGFKYTETTRTTDEAGNVFVREVDKEALPDTTAAIFWLKNRKPLEWRDKQDIALLQDEQIKQEMRMEFVRNIYDLKLLTEKQLRHIIKLAEAGGNNEDFRAYFWQSVKENAIDEYKKQQEETKGA